jgi:ribose transport system ATP-binding protein
MTELVRLEAITKSFGGVHALRGVDFDIRAGEVHALLGENGAGKSTLMRVLNGEFPPTSGHIRIGGQPVTLKDPHAARAHGITVVHQELALAPDLSVAENIFLGELPGMIGWNGLKARARKLIERLGFDIDPGAIVGNLTVAHQQVVEIAKALSRDVKIIVFDEPSAVLSSQDADRLHQIIADLRNHGVGIVYISHRLEEIFKIADRMTVMKDGQLVGTVRNGDVTIDQLISMMVGRPLSALFPERRVRSLGKEVLRVEKINAGRMVRDISFSVRAGEIVGLGGLVGSGRTEVARAIFGADEFDRGEIIVDGRPIRIRSPREAIRMGIGLVPEDRKLQALVLSLAIRENLSLSLLDRLSRFGVVRLAAERALARRMVDALRVRTPSIEQKVLNLSGGNQQKVVIAKWLALHPKILIMDEPTRGIDIGAKAEVHGLMHQLAADGVAILMISSELPEIVHMSDRILVMRQGRIAGELARAEATQEAVMALATGVLASAETAA